MRGMIMRFETVKVGKVIMTNGEGVGNEHYYFNRKEGNIFRDIE